MKKIIALLLACSMLLSLCACSPAASAASPSATPTVAPAASPMPTPEPTPTPITSLTDDPEILRAAANGFLPKEIIGDWDKAVTFSQFCAMVKAMLQVYDASLVPKWEQVAAQAMTSGDKMHRDHGMLAIYYAACLMGLGQTTRGDWNYLAQVVRIETINGFDDRYEKWFPECGSQSPFLDIAYKHRLAQWDYVTSSRYWCLGQTSPVSGKLVFDVDFEHKSLRPTDALSRKEAIWAVLRLYESTLKTPEAIFAGKEIDDILAAADKRRNTLLNSQTEIVKSVTFVQGKTYTGTAYYVSNSGKDSNSGTSPETPWATIAKVNAAKLKNGDAVFFKRGDTWCGKQLWGQSGVTYSAYGEGAKPTISGSVAEKAASADKWKLYYTGTNGEKIWVYHADLLDCTGVFFDGGKSWANKVTPRWDGKQYTFDTGESFDAKNGLTKDLDFFCCL
jgi:hypothetical protein